MALTAKRSWIIAYDISDPKRLGRVYRLMCKRGIPQQRSVFRATMTTNEARRLLRELAALIDQHGDDVRMYPLPATRKSSAWARAGVTSRDTYLSNDPPRHDETGSAPATIPAKHPAKCLSGMDNLVLAA